jgi:glycosyltransferase involved in cell wall biosynthesis
MEKPERLQGIDSIPAPVTIAICTYNRSTLLPGLVGALRAQQCPLRFEILVIDNNSSDATQDTLQQLAALPGAKLRWVREATQGIVHARNRAIAETTASEYLVFIDDDELPRQGFINAALDALSCEGAECVGGRITVDFTMFPRPKWLEDDVLGFLGALDYGRCPLWIETAATPLWSGNIAYRRALFDRLRLRFDVRYNRAGEGLGGGEDAAMFRTLLSAGTRMRYRPDMAITHRVDATKLRRRYFLRLHWLAGRKFGQFETLDYARTWFGIPPFMLIQALKHSGKALLMIATRRPTALRQGMNAAHAWGMIHGTLQRLLESKK